MTTELFSSVKIEYFWRCGVCGESCSDFRHIAPGEQIYRPSIPKGWRFINGEFYCPKHYIELRIDETRIPQ
jgi:hypothetical protein